MHEDKEDTLPSCSSFACDEGEKLNYLEDDLTLPSAEDEDVTLPSAAETLSHDYEDDHDKLQVHLAEENIISTFSKPLPTPLMSSTPKKSHHMYESSDLAISSSQLDLIDEEPSGCATDILQWQLTAVIKFNGCSDMCAIMVHGLTNYDVLRAHYHFENKTQREQNNWVIQYLSMHCPYNSTGEKDLKNMIFRIQGKSVCMKLWLEVLALSISRFYRLRQDFLQFGGITSATKRQRSVSAKTLEAITWMEQYFQRVGDKCPDKGDSIYLPTCLTETKLFEIFLEDMYKGDSSHSISHSQFNKLFRKDFRHVTIPKVSGEKDRKVVPQHC